MKKLIILLLALVMLVSLCACGGGNDTPATTEPEETAKPETSTDVIYHFGDTITADMVEFTPVFEGFADKLANWPDKDFMTPEGQFSGSTPYAASDEKVMMYFSGTINYVGDSKENVNFVYDFTIDYNNGYLFDFVGGDAFNSGKGYHSDCGITDNIESGDWDYENSAIFEPLSSNKTRYVRFCIEVPKQLETDTNNILITFHIAGSDYVYSMA